MELKTVHTSHCISPANVTCLYAFILIYGYIGCPIPCWYKDKYVYVPWVDLTDNLRLWFVVVGNILTSWVLGNLVTLCIFTIHLETLNLKIEMFDTLQPLLALGFIMFFSPLGCSVSCWQFTCVFFPSGGVYLSKIVQSKARLFTRNIRDPGAAFEYVLFINSEEQKCVCIFQAGHLLEGPPGWDNC